MTLVEAAEVFKDKIHKDYSKLIDPNNSMKLTIDQDIPTDQEGGEIIKLNVMDGDVLKFNVVIKKIPNSTKNKVAFMNLTHGTFDSDKEYYVAPITIQVISTFFRNSLQISHLLNSDFKGEIDFLKDAIRNYQSNNILLHPTAEETEINCITVEK